MRPVPGRLHAHSLDRPRFDSAVGVVRHLGCVQSQLLDMALWAVARRMDAPTLADLQRAVDDGDVLRTHVLRPTWHLVAPDDVHWLLALTGPRVRRLLEATNRSIGLTTATVDRGVAVVLDALAAGIPLTRRELAVVLAESGLTLTGQGVAHVMMSAEIDALVVNGPMAGRQHTYRLLEDGPATRPRDELLADVARRYADGHGPFRDRDLAWWTSLTLTDARRAIELGGLRPLDVDGETHWALDEPAGSDTTEVPRAMLLPNFDEYISYARDPADHAGLGLPLDEVMRATGLLFVDGRLAGSWTRTITTRRVAIDVQAGRRLTAPVRRALTSEAEAFGHFVGREPELRIAD